MPRRILFTRLIDFMASQGYRVVDESIGEGFIRFRDSSREVVLRVVEDTSRDEVLSTVIQAAFDAASGKAAYVAMPIELVSKIGDHAFRIHRIGVLVYDSHSVFELVSGEPRGKAKQAAINKEDRNDERFAVMLESLSARLTRLEEAMARLALLDELRTRLDILEGMVLSQKTRKAVEEERSGKPAQVEVVKEPVEHAETGRELPSFLRENPWLDILSGKSS
ncbi:MAG: hypothetical protein NXY59_05535 [Aigarchaeota archaeon]|nr:hypothetical protein [Candidatus Pelearchaeum maunauluense]